MATTDITSGFVEREQDLTVISSGEIIPIEDLKKFEFELRNYHLQSGESIAKHFETSQVNGLKNHLVEKRRQENGPNVVSASKQPPIWLKFLLCFVAGFAPLLWIATGLAFISWRPFGIPPANVYNLILAVVLLLVIFFSGIFQFYQELKASMLMNSFKNLVPSTCIVIRDGKQVEIMVSELVVGDLVNLTSQKVPSDIRVLSNSGLKVDKSMLTGESLPVRIKEECEKDTVTYLEASNMIFMGCTIVEGKGVGIVVSTGHENQLSKIIEQTSQKLTATSLEVELNRAVIIIGSLAAITTLLVVLWWVFYLRVKHDGYMILSAMISNAIGITVSFVPEGLPISLTIGLTYVARRLCFEHSVLVKSLSRIETLGSISLLASDKTGTLTQNLMTVTGIISSLSISMSGKEKEGSEFHNNEETQKWTEIICFLCNQSIFETTTTNQDKSLESIEEGIEMTTRVAIGGNATDRALLNWVEPCRLTKAENQNEFKVLIVLPFSSVLKLSASVIEQTSSKEKFVLIKGAPEYILRLCNSFINKSGKVEEMDENFPQVVLNAVDDEANKGNRVVALAKFGPLDNSVFNDDFKFEVDPEINFPMSNFTFVSCASVSDPPRESVKEAIEELRGAGIRVAMVTGDAVNTAVAISRAVGIVTSESVDTLRDYYNKKEMKQIQNENETGVVLKEMRSCTAIAISGKDIEGINDSMTWDYIFEHKELVFARTTPEQKLQIVKESQSRNFRVAVTGDGVNDSPALKKADIGIAMNAGSDVAKDVASMILLNNDFNAITKGVKEGRLIFENLRKVIGYLIAAGCWGEVLPVLANFFLGLPTPLSSFLMIMISCVTDVFAGVAIMAEEPENDIMKLPPRDLKKARLLDFKLIGYSYFFYASMESIGAFYNYFHYMANRGDTRLVPTPIPSDDFTTSGVDFPAGYRAGQLLFAWNWGGSSGNLGTDETNAAKVASSVFFVTLVVSQWGHLMSIRRKTPYFYDAIMGTAPGSENKNVVVRMWGELIASKIRWPVISAIILAMCTTFIVNEPEFFNQYCYTGTVPGKYWGMAIGWSLLWFIIAEIRKWIIVLFPKSLIAQYAW